MSSSSHWRELRTDRKYRVEQVGGWWRRRKKEKLIEVRVVCSRECGDAIADDELCNRNYGIRGTCDHTETDRSAEVLGHHYRPGPFVQAGVAETFATFFLLPPSRLVVAVIHDVPPITET